MIRELTITEMSQVSGGGFFHNLVKGVSTLGLGAGIGLTVLGGVVGLGGAVVGLGGGLVAAASLLVPILGLPATAIGGVVGVVGAGVAVLGFAGLALGIGLTVASGIGLGGGKPATTTPATPAAAH